MVLTNNKKNPEDIKGFLKFSVSFITGNEQAVPLEDEKIEPGTEQKVFIPPSVS